MIEPRRRTFLILVAAALLGGCAGDSEDEPDLPRGSEKVELDAGDFAAKIDNPYWPMRPGSRWLYRETDVDGTVQRVEVTVTNRKKKIAGIEATVVHDVVTEDGELIEDTFDWYAQDKAGNVWYLGEDTKEFENGKVASTKGSWEHGADGAQAGIVMPAEPKAGLAYRQEQYAGEAEDRAEILSLDERVEVPFGAFQRVLMTKDTTPLEPAIAEHKFYAKGIGPVLILAISGGGGREELIEFRR